MTTVANLSSYWGLLPASRRLRLAWSECPLEAPSREGEKRGASDHLGAWDPRRRVHADSGHGRDYLSGVSEKTWDGGKSSTLWHVAPSGDCLSLLKTPNKAIIITQDFCRHRTKPEKGPSALLEMESSPSELKSGVGQLPKSIRANEKVGPSALRRKHEPSDRCWGMPLGGHWVCHWVCHPCPSVTGEQYQVRVAWLRLTKLRPVPLF